RSRRPRRDPGDSQRRAGHGGDPGSPRRGRTRRGDRRSRRAAGAAASVVNDPYRIRVAASAARVIQHKLPEAIAGAVTEFITGSLLENPHRAGHALRRELDGVYSARRGAFRVLYEIDDAIRLATVLRVEHRADVYRPR